MKNFFLASVACLLVACNSVSACPTQRRLVVPAAVFTPIVTSAFVPVLVPQYSTTYDPGVDVQGLQQEMKALRLQIQKLQTVPPVPTEKKSSRAGPQDALAAYTAVVKTKCASCHHDSNAKAKGGNFVLLAGANYDPAKLSDKAIWKILVRTHKNEMPLKGEPLTDSEYAAVVDAVELLGGSQTSLDDGGQVLEDLVTSAADATLVGCPTSPNAFLLRRRFGAAAAVSPFVPVQAVQALVLPAFVPAFVPAVPIVVGQAAIVAVPAPVLGRRLARPLVPVLAAPRVGVLPFRSAFRGARLGVKFGLRGRGR